MSVAIIYTIDVYMIQFYIDALVFKGNFGWYGICINL
jgi:hypothetical protein